MHPITYLELRLAEDLAVGFRRQQAGQGQQVGIGRFSQRGEDALRFGLLLRSQVHDGSPGEDFTVPIQTPTRLTDFPPTFQLLTLDGGLSHFSGLTSTDIEKAVFAVNRSQALPNTQYVAIDPASLAAFARHAAAGQST